MNRGIGEHCTYSTVPVPGTVLYQVYIVRTYTLFKSNQFRRIGLLFSILGVVAMDPGFVDSHFFQFTAQANQIFSQSKPIWENHF